MLTEVHWLAPLSTLLFACLLPPFPSAFRRARRRPAFGLILVIAALISTGFALFSPWDERSQLAFQSEFQILAFGVCCGIVAHATACDLFIRRVSNWHCLGVSGTALVSAYLSDTFLQAGLSSLSALATLCLAAMIANRATGQPSLGRGDLIFVATIALWVEPAQLPFAFLIAIATTLSLRLIPGISRTSRLPFIPGLALGFCLMAAFW